MEHHLVRAQALQVVLEGGATPWWQNWLPILGSCVVAAATLAGVLISANRTREVFVGQRAEARRDRQRTIIADLIVAARAHSALAQVSIMAMAIVRSESELIELLNTDSAALERELVANRDRALLHAQIEILDADLRVHVEKVATAIEASRASEDTSTVVNRKASGGDRLRAAARQSGRLAAITLASDALFMEAVRVLPVHLSDKRGRRRKKTEKQLSK